MNLKNFSLKNHFPAELAYFIALAPIFNLFALTTISQPVLFYAIQFFGYLYMLTAPGFFLLPFIVKKKLPFGLGIAFSVAVSLFCLMLIGLGLNTFLPMLGLSTPLSLIPLLIAFDILIMVLFTLNAIYDKEFIIEVPHLNLKSWIVVGSLALIPILATLGSIILNNHGTELLTMTSLILIGVLMLVVLFDKDKLDPTVAPISLFLMSLGLLLMNSMRGWFITGHDILLEYHVFVLTTEAHRWSMAFYQDPYNACLSLTILPTYLQTLLHMAPAYVFKFYTQFLGALPVVLVYYLNRRFLSQKLAYLAGFLYMTFPTFMVDMAFLNRQGIAFLFFGAMIITILAPEYFSARTRRIALFMFGIGMIFSHYSTSYIAVPVLIVTYFLNRLMRFAVKLRRPAWMARWFSKLKNRDVYEEPILLTLPFVIGLLAAMVLWSTVITKTSKSFVNTIQQIMVSLKEPFSLEEQTGPAKYSLVKAQQPTPEELLTRFVKFGIDKQKVVEHPSEFFPLEVTQKYPAAPVLEISAQTTTFGSKVESLLNIDLGDFFITLKQLYAKILQVLLMVGLIGIALGYSFKRHLKEKIPVEFIALSISGVIVMVGQTILPAGAIDYGLLRLFHQNLLFLSLPIFLGFITFCSLLSKNHIRQLIYCSAILLFFYSILSGIVPQLTGGGRPMLSLNNTGLYYDSYYTHGQEVASAEWIAQYKGSRLPIQAAHFSDIKMIAYGHIGSYIELLPETTKKKSFVYLNYDNVKSSNILEIIYGDVVYYHFPMEFLNTHKNLIYNNGGSEIYR